MEVRKEMIEVYMAYRRGYCEWTEAGREALPNFGKPAEAGHGRRSGKPSGRPRSRWSRGEGPERGNDRKRTDGPSPRRWLALPLINSQLARSGLLNFRIVGTIVLNDPLAISIPSLNRPNHMIISDQT